MDKNEAIKKINEGKTIEEKIDGALYMANIAKNTSAMIMLGDYYFNTKKIELAIAYYKKAIEHKNAIGYTRLGFMYYYGKGIEKDYNEAFKLFSRGSLEGETTSIIKLSDMYKNGYYVEQNYGTSINILDPLFQKGMNDLLNKKYKNNPIFEVVLRYADFFLNGYHFKKNLRKALNYYILAYRGFMLQDNSKDHLNKINYCLNNINTLKEELSDLYNDYELLDFAFDHDFTFDYKIDDNALLIFNFTNNELFIDIKNLTFDVYKQVNVKFSNIEKFNKVDYEVLRPHDYRIEKKKLRLYDDESTLMHFEFENIEMSAN